MGNDHREQGVATGDAEALIRRVERAKKSCKRATGGSGEAQEPECGDRKARLMRECYAMGRYHALQDAIYIMDDPFCQQHSDIIRSLLESLKRAAAVQVENVYA